MNYEIHITVPCNDRLDAFKAACKELGVRPIVIDAYPLVEVMTSYRMQTEDQNAAFKEMTRQALHLGAKGFQPIRTKVETDLNHPGALTPLPNQYFEAHIHLPLDEAGLENLKGLREGIDFYLSRNTFSEDYLSKQVHIITIRQYHTFPHIFARRIAAFTSVLKSEGFDIPWPVENEFALFDSNPEHDQPWFQHKDS